VGIQAAERASFFDHEPRSRRNKATKTLHPDLPAEEAIWGLNFRQGALDVAIVEINNKTDLKIEIQSLERWKHRRVTAVIFVIQEQAVPKKGD
jgi:hypothetical protein